MTIHPSVLAKGITMAYGTLLLHLDEQPQLEAHIETAIHLACRFGSHLTGLAATGNKPFEASTVADFLKQDQLSDALASARRLAQERVRRFTERARHSSLAGFDTCIDDDDEAPALVRAGRCSDLVILGQPDPDFRGHSERRAQFEQALLHGAPPALVLPFCWRGAEVGTRILIGWNDTRECARAVAASMPMLRQAAEVHIAGFVPSLAAEAVVAPLEVDRVRDWLARNDVKADVWVHATSDDAGSCLLAHAAQRGTNLIVMGAWGHARWTERWFGGATHTILARTTVPVLLAR